MLFLNRRRKAKSRRMNATSGIKKAGEANIAVSVRVRPLNRQEEVDGRKAVVKAEPLKNILVQRIQGAVNPSNREVQERFSFNSTFGPETSQEDLYNSVARPLVIETLHGYNSTIFCYGQTGTGKTFTMEGVDFNNWVHSSGEGILPESAGLIPRAVDDIFKHINESGVESTVRISHLEIYNEKLQDLLAPLDNAPEPKIFNGKGKDHMLISGLEEFVVKDTAEVLRFLKVSLEKRTTAQTGANERSSRSHCIFSLTVHMKETLADGDDVLKVGKLYLVDLAGSESATVSSHTQETRNINTSLLTLGKVIKELNEHHRHVSYRESKLTRLLQESLGGKAKTAMVATVAPTDAAVDQTLNTLRYAQQAMNVKNKPEANERRSRKNIVREYLSEIERLQRELAAIRSTEGVVHLPVERFNALEEQAKGGQTAAEKTAEIEAQLVAVGKEFDAARQTLTLTEHELERARSSVRTLKSELGTVYIERDALQQNEARARKTAKELNSELSASIGDITRLFNQLESHQIHETKTAEKVSRFQANLTALVGQLNESLDTMEAQYSGGISSGLQLLGERTAEGAEAIDELKSTLDSLHDKSGSTLVESIDSYIREEMATQTTEGSAADDLKSTIEALQKSIGATEANINGNLASLRVSIDSVDSTLFQTHEAVKQSTTKATKAVDGCRTTLKRTLHGLAESHSDAIAQLQQRMGSDVETTMASKVGLRRMATDLSSAFTAQIQSMAAEMMSEFTKRVEAAIDESVGRTRGYAGELDAFNRATSKAVQESAASVSDALKAVTESSVATEAAVGGLDTLSRSLSSLMPTKAQFDSIRDGLGVTANKVAALRQIRVDAGTDAARKLRNNIAQSMSADRTAISDITKSLESIRARLDAVAGDVESEMTTGTTEGALAVHTARQSATAIAKLSGVLDVEPIRPAGTPIAPRTMPAVSIPSPVKRTALINRYRTTHGTPSVAADRGRQGRALWASTLTPVQSTPTTPVGHQRETGFSPRPSSMSRPGPIDVPGTP
ncbi:Kinesin motor domain [Carpediemonas membranifera]|uniref:Kinesin motor domain n=1 Tax=Carpediemonas membranifera TaxID=201153 RepID=A0A8J6B5E0_9EUKA|nr:Kinesin motor domain [Carpediemonas membranifera]|eukprot:KAG9393227.1 Kinesin motor domain [Carpediemonas membranifera]